MPRIALAVAGVVLIVGCGTGEYEDRMQSTLSPPPPPAKGKQAAPADPAAAPMADPAAAAAPADPAAAAAPAGMP